MQATRIFIGGDAHLELTNVKNASCETQGGRIYTSISFATYNKDLEWKAEFLRENITSGSRWLIGETSLKKGLFQFSAMSVNWSSSANGSTDMEILYRNLMGLQSTYYVMKRLRLAPFVEEGLTPSNKGRWAD